MSELQKAIDQTKGLIYLLKLACRSVTTPTQDKHLLGKYGKRFDINKELIRKHIEKAPQ